MKLRRLSQEDVGAAVDVSQGQVSKWVRGQNVPDIYQAHKLATILLTDIAYLADDSLDHEPGPALSASEQSLLDAARRLDGGADEALYRVLNFKGAKPGDRPGQETTYTTEKTSVERKRTGA